jgi:FkbM family methyltransferase
MSIELPATPRNLVTYRNQLFARRIVQRALLRCGIWLTPLDVFRRFVASTYYRKGEFSFVQVGANDGVSFDDFYWLVKRFNGKGLVIEPMADAFERLAHNYRPFPDVRPIRTAVHPTAKSLELVRVRNDAMSQVPSWAFGSASLTPNWLQGQGIAESNLETETVPAQNLTQILEENKISDLDVLQVDVEGFDHDVIRMINFANIRPRIIKYERLQPHVENHVERERDMGKYLGRQGYQIRQCGMDTVAILR